jgi:hypothetical protein
MQAGCEEHSTVLSSLAYLVLQPLLIVQNYDIMVDG